MLRSKSRSGYLEIGQKKHSSLFRSISRSKFCRGDALASQVDKEALVSVDRNSSSLSENRIVKAAMMQKQISNLEEDLKNTKVRLEGAETERIRVIAELREIKERAFSELKSLEDSLSNSMKEIKSRDNEISLLSNRLESAKVFEIKLGERDASVEELKKRILELEDQVEKTKKSESNLLESLMLQTRQSEQTKFELEESKLEVAKLKEKLKIGSDQKDNLNSSLETKTLKDEIKLLKNEVRLATEAEEKSKKAMDDLALALREVVTEANAANEKLKLSEEQVNHQKEEIKQLNRELELQVNTSERLRVEAEESILAWSAKEMGFISCLRKADEENASLKNENNKLNEALAAAENITRITREEAFMLHDIPKQALNESSSAKQGSNIAQPEYSELKDLLAEKEESLHFVTKENERSRINEVVDGENVIANKPCEDQEQTDVITSLVSTLYEDHLDERITPQHMFSSDSNYMKVFNKEDDTMFVKQYDDTEAVSDDDPENAEALKLLAFDSGYTDSSGSGQFEEVDNIEFGRSYGVHNEDSEDKGFNMYGLYDRKKLFRKIGELIVGITNSKEEGLMIDQGKEQGKEQT